MRARSPARSRCRFSSSPPASFQLEDGVAIENPEECACMVMHTAAAALEDTSATPALGQDCSYVKESARAYGYC